MSGILGATAIILGVTRLGFIPVPNVAGDATIMHVPAILGGVLEGPVVGLLVGAIFGLFSLLEANTPIFEDPLVSVVPRLFIGLVAYLVFAGLKNVNLYLAWFAAALLGTLTNTALVLSMAVLRGYIPPSVVTQIMPQALAEMVIAIVLTIALARSIDLIQAGKSAWYADRDESESD